MKEVHDNKGKQPSRKVKPRNSRHVCTSTGGRYSGAATPKEKIKGKIDATRGGGGGMEGGRSAVC